MSKRAFRLVAVTVVATMGVGVGTANGGDVTLRVMSGGGVVISEADDAGAVRLADAFVASPATGPTTRRLDAERARQEELEALLAPVALYPDEVLSQVLMASTYPLEIVHAERWQKANSALVGEELKKELEEKPWDASVKSLVNVPSVLAMMSEKLEWTEKLGDAVVRDQAGVMDTVQGLRRRAQGNGTLKSDEKVRVEARRPSDATAVGGGSEAIVIEPAEPEVVYVPVYEPAEVYGGWWGSGVAPAYWGSGGHRGLRYGEACRLGPAWGYAWGRPDWSGRSVVLDFDRGRRWNDRIPSDRIRDSYFREHPDLGRPGGTVFQYNPWQRGGYGYRDSGGLRLNGGWRSFDGYRGQTRAVGGLVQGGYPGGQPLYPGVEPANRIPGGVGPGLPRPVANPVGGTDSGVPRTGRVTVREGIQRSGSVVQPVVPNSPTIIAPGSGNPSAGSAGRGSVSSPPTGRVTAGSGARR